MTIYFPKETPFGKEAAELLELIKRVNVRPRFVRSELKLTYKNYVELISSQALTADLIYAFRDCLQAFHARSVSQAKINHEKKEDRLSRVLNMTLPLDDWTAISIQNENDMGPEYFENLRAKEREHDLRKTLDIPRQFDKGEIEDTQWQRYLTDMLKHKL